MTFVSTSDASSNSGGHEAGLLEMRKIYNGVVVKICIGDKEYSLVLPVHRSSKEEEKKSNIM